MTSFRIEGGHRLQGEIAVQGAKNEALQVISACLLTRHKLTIHNVPQILDIRFLHDLLSMLGVVITTLSDHSYEYDASDISSKVLTSEDFIRKAGSIRGSILILGPLLSRFPCVYVAIPGGDKIGRRRLDGHFQGLTALGAEVEFEGSHGRFVVRAGELKGSYIHLEETSVTGTANIIMAAVRAKGTTTLYNAACEPYIQQLCRMLNEMGAKIEGVGSNLLRIEGVLELQGAEHTVDPDMIEVGSFIGLGALTRSELTISNVNPARLGIIPNVFEKLGIHFEVGEDRITMGENDHYRIKTFMDGSILTVTDGVWPAFTPDLISILIVTAIQGSGTLLVHQRMFESRLFFVDQLIQMGAKIILCDPHRVTVIGMDRESPLRGLPMNSPDIRAGIALLLAALSAQGVSTIRNIEQIDRGYQFIEDRLNRVGARIERLEEHPASAAHR